MFISKKINDNLYVITEKEQDQKIVFCMQLVVGTKKAALIDCGLKESNELISLIKSITNLPVALYLTHGHGDHIGNIKFFDEVHIGAPDAKLLGEDIAYIPLSHSEEIELGSVKLEAYALSGHSEGAFCFLNKESGYALTGDIVNQETWLCWGSCDNPLQYAKKIKKALEKFKESGIKEIYEGHCSEPHSISICDDIICSLNEIVNGSVFTDGFHHDEYGRIKNQHRYKKSTIIYDKERIIKMIKGFTITPNNIPNGGIMFVDHESKFRSGHMGHALVEYAKDSILAFYSNCSAAIENGHTGYGWMEYKRTTDGGKTWSEGKILDYSWQCFVDGVCNISCEKAVCADDGTIVLFCLRNKKITRWEPYLEPVILRSFDGGETWTEAKFMTHYRGRVMDAFVHNGVIYALEFCNDAEIKWTGNLEEHVYRLFVSTDNGENFNELSVIPFDTFGRSYGAMEILPNGDLIAYNYNENDEYNQDYCISHDMGKTWDEPAKTYFAKRIRNPQICQAGGIYFMHGRSGGVSGELPFNFVLYTSKDGINWDEGEYVRVTPENGWGGYSYYSNNCVTGRFGGEKRILIQASDPYDKARVNIKHWWIDISNE